MMENDNESKKRTRLEFEGKVVDSNKGKFKVLLNNNMTVICVLSGKIKMNSVKILVGDNVIVEVSEYDTAKGRIVYRNKS